MPFTIQLSFHYIIDHEDDHYEAVSSHVQGRSLWKPFGFEGGIEWDSGLGFYISFESHHLLTYITL
jgi:hypothetical protein